MLLDRSSDPAPSVRVQRAAVSVVFFLNGLVFANWVTRIPAVSDRTQASPGQLGLALLCIAIGSIAAMALVGRWSTCAAAVRSPSSAGC